MIMYPLHTLESLLSQVDVISSSVDAIHRQAVENGREIRNLSVRLDKIEDCIKDCFDCEE